MMSMKGMTRREFLRLAGISSVGLVAAACAPAVAPASAPAGGATTAPVAAPPSALPRSGGILKMDDGIGRIDGTQPLGLPAKITSPIAYRVVAPAIETLLRNDKSGNVVPWLATSFTPDVAGKTLTLALRKGVKFHDGTDMDAEAVKWNLEQCLSAKTQGTEKWKSVDVVDAATIRINLTEWDSTVTSYLSQFTGMIISPAAFKKNGADWASTHPVGTGPFQLDTWEKAVRLSFKKFEGYWQSGKPYLDRIEVTYTPDAVTQELTLRARQLDLIITQNNKALSKFEQDGFKVNSINIGAGAYTLVPNSSTPDSPWANLKVRQAAQHAIDTEGIVKGIMDGRGEPANQWAYKAHWSYNPDIKGYPYNPARAKELLAEAGYANGFKTTITYSTGSLSEEVYLAVANYLKAVGIDAQLDVAQSARIQQIQFGGKWEGVVYGGSSANPDPIIYLGQRYSGSSGKYYVLMDAASDYLKALQNATAAPDFATKQRSLQEALKLMSDKYASLLFMYCGLDSAVSSTAVRNHGFMSSAHTGIWTPEEVWMAQA